MIDARPCTRSYRACTSLGFVLVSLFYASQPETEVRGFDMRITGLRGAFVGALIKRCNVSIAWWVSVRPFSLFFPLLSEQRQRKCELLADDERVAIREDFIPPVGHLVLCRKRDTLTL